MIEVVAALTILSIAGVTAVTMTAESIRAVDRAREADEEFRAANELMEAAAVWPREDLERRLGDRAQGPWRMVIERPVPTLFTVLLSDSATGRVLLRTSLYRADVADDTG